MSVQPLPRRRSAATRTIPTTRTAGSAGAGARPAPGSGPDPDTDRLLRTWLSVAVKFAAAVSHDLPEGTALLRQLSAIEEALLERHPDLFEHLSGFLVWGAALVHDGTGRVEDCLVCRRALVDLPLDLPLPPAPRGGTRPGGAR